MCYVGRHIDLQWMSFDIPLLCITGQCGFNKIGLFDKKNKKKTLKFNYVSMKVSGNLGIY